MDPSISDLNYSGPDSLTLLTEHAAPGFSGFHLCFFSLQNFLSAIPRITDLFFVHCWALMVIYPSLNLQHTCNYSSPFQITEIKRKYIFAVLSSSVPIFVLVRRSLLIINQGFKFIECSNLCHSSRVSSVDKMANFGFLYIWSVTK